MLFSVSEKLSPLREFVTSVVSLHNREETLCIGAIFVFTLLFKCKTNTFNGPLEKNILRLFVIKSPLKSCPISVLSLRQIRFSTGYITLTQWTEYPFIHCQICSLSYRRIIFFLENEVHGLRQRDVCKQWYG